MKTNAVRLLDKLGIVYELRHYEVDPEHMEAEAVAHRYARRAGVQDAGGAR